MARLAFSVFVVSAALQFSGCGGRALNGQEAETRKVQTSITIAKDVTFVTGPVGKDGYIDYAAALNNRYRQGKTAENNAAVCYIRAMGPRPEGTELQPEFFEQLGIPRPPDDGEYFVGLGVFAASQVGDRPDADVAYELLGQAMAKPWKRGQYPLIAEWLDKVKEPLKLAVEGTKRPEYYFPLLPPKVDNDEHGMSGLIAALLPHVQLTRSIARALVCRAMLHAGEGRTDEAWDDLLACHRLGRHNGQGPTMIEALVGIAIDGIAINADVQFVYQTRPTAEQVKKYLGDLDSLPPLPSMAEKVNFGERMMFLDSVQRLAQGGNLSDLMGEQENTLDGILRTLSSGAIDWNITMRMGNEWYDRIQEALREGDHGVRAGKLSEIENDMQALVQEVKKPWSLAGSMLLNPRKAMGTTVGRVLIALLLPAVSAASTAEDRATQTFRNVRVAFALAAFHHDNGRYPEQLSDLAPRYLEAIPGDLFAARPLHYRPDGDGYLLYSVGANGLDDGGRWYDDTPPADDPSIRIPPVREQD